MTLLFFIAWALIVAFIVLILYITFFGCESLESHSRKILVAIVILLIASTLVMLVREEETQRPYREGELEANEDLNRCKSKCGFSFVPTLNWDEMKTQWIYSPTVLVNGTQFNCTEFLGSDWWESSTECKCHISDRVEQLLLSVSQDSCSFNFQATPS